MSWYKEKIEILFPHKLGYTSCQYAFKNKPNQPPFLETLYTLRWNLKGLWKTSRLHKNIRFLLLKSQITFLLNLQKFSMLSPKLPENSAPILMLFFPPFPLLKREEFYLWTTLNYKESIAPKKSPTRTQILTFINELFTQLFLKKKLRQTIALTLLTHLKSGFGVIQWQTIIIWISLSKYVLTSHKSINNC